MEKTAAVPRAVSLLWLWILYLMFLGAAAAPNPNVPARFSLVSRNSDSTQQQCGGSCASCTSPSKPKSSSTSKRTEDGLFKRVMSNPWDSPWNGLIEEYVSDQLADEDTIDIDQYRSDGAQLSVARYRELRDEPFSLALGQLLGCSSVIVVSQKAVYISHRWEVYAYSPGGLVIGTDEEFQKQVLDELSNGGGPDMPSLRQYAGENGNFAQMYKPAAFVIKRDSAGLPVENMAYNQAYDDKNERLAHKVTEILGFAPTVVTYNTAEPIDVLIKGRVLFQYDPEGLDDCEPQQAMSRLWKEKWALTQDIWDPWPEQKVNYDDSDDEE